MPIFKTLGGILGSGASKPVCLLVASEALNLLILSWFWLLLAFSPFSLFSFQFCCSSRFCCFKQLFLIKIHHSLICSQQQWLLGFTLWVWEFDSCSSPKPEPNCKAGTLEPWNLLLGCKAGVILQTFWWCLDMFVQYGVLQTFVLFCPSKYIFIVASALWILCLVLSEKSVPSQNPMVNHHFPY